LGAHLKLISEAARRAATLIRTAAPKEAGAPIRPQPNPPPLAPAA
jgi:hypothetical protein